MKYYRYFFFVILFCFIQSVSAQKLSSLNDADFNIRIVAAKLSDPWEVTYGPDDFLWVTESKGYRVLRIDPASGKQQVLADLNGERHFPRYDKIPDEQDGGKPWPQGGLMGMALHPQLSTGKPYVYLAYIYKYQGASSAGDGKDGSEGYHFLLRIERYTYNVKEAKLTKSAVVCDTIPASNDHNGGRLTVSPVNGKFYLFYSTGDMGAGQFLNGGRINHAQNKLSYEGKILRFNLEADEDPDKGDQYIPNDNPFSGVRQNAVWTVGHRNPQGLAYGAFGGKDILYAVEHGPFSDDEVNIIEKGRNYGHPLIIGYDDGNYNELAAAVSDHLDYPGIWHTSYPLIKNEKQNSRSIGKDYRNPVKSFYPTSNAMLAILFEKIKNKNEVEWKSFAPSSIEVYRSDAIPGWKNSLLIPTLKGSRLLRLKLDENGNIADQRIHEYAKGKVRYRDIAVSPDGLKLYLAVDSSSVTSGPSKEDPKEISYRGCILELQYKALPKQPAKRPD